MNILIQGTPVHGIDPETPVSELSLPQLQLLWEEVNRNREPLHVIALLEGKEEPEMDSELLILKLCDALRAHGVRPFEETSHA